MKLIFAPMEGISTYIYRRLHARFFGGVEEYFALFIAPDGSGSFKSSALRDILPENNRDITLIPQLLVNRPEPFVHVAGELAAMGYGEVNLNIGCPSSTVVAKHKGSGMLLDLEGLDRCLNEIFSRSPLAVSIKTRMGLESTEEFPRILEIYKKYPLKRLIIHARARSGMYRSPVDIQGFLYSIKTLIHYTFPFVFSMHIIPIGSNIDSVYVIIPVNIFISFPKQTSINFIPIPNASKANIGTYLVSFVFINL